MRSFIATTSRSTLSLMERGYRNGWIISRNSAASVCVAGHAARLDQHHPLPGLAPLRVVILVAGQRTAERAGIAFGPQPQVDAVQRAFRRHAAHLGDEGLGQAVEELMVGQRRARRSLLFAGRLLEDAAFLAIDEEHIHIRAVIEFLSAELAHAQHAAGGRLPVPVGILVPGLAVTPGELPVADLPDRVQADIGHVGDLLDDLRQLARAGRGRARRCGASRAA